MSNELLPPSFDEDLLNAVTTFWTAREKGSSKQEGTRGRVIGGKNLDGFQPLLENLVVHCGFASDSVRFTSTTLPGYFRPTKKWDALILDEGELIAVIELKSQVGSFGNNFNNRTEEALGNAVDFQEAGRRQLYQQDGRPGSTPFLGYLMVLQDVIGSQRPVGASSSHFDVLEEFRQASYAERYQIFCERLMEERLYDGAGLILTSPPGNHRSLTSKTSALGLFARLAGHLQAHRALVGAE